MTLSIRTYKEDPALLKSDLLFCSKCFLYIFKKLFIISVADVREDVNKTSCTVMSVGEDRSSYLVISLLKLFSLIICSISYLSFGKRCLNSGSLCRLCSLYGAFADLLGKNVTVISHGLADLIKLRKLLIKTYKGSCRYNCI